MNPDLRGNQASMKLELMPFVAALKYATESEHLKLFYCFVFLSPIPVRNTDEWQWITY